MRSQETSWEISQSIRSRRSRPSGVSDRRAAVLSLAMQWLPLRPLWTDAKSPKKKELQ